VSLLTWPLDLQVSFDMASHLYVSFDMASASDAGVCLSDARISARYSLQHTAACCSMLQHVWVYPINETPCHVKRDLYECV